VGDRKDAPTPPRSPAEMRDAAAKDDLDTAKAWVSFWADHAAAAWPVINAAKEHAANIAADARYYAMSALNGFDDLADADAIENAKHDLRTLLRKLPLPAGDTLSTDGWNSDMEKAPRDAVIDIWGRYDADTPAHRFTDCRWKISLRAPKGAWCRRGSYIHSDGYGNWEWEPLGVLVAWRLPPDPPPG